MLFIYFALVLCICVLRNEFFQAAFEIRYNFSSYGFVCRSPIDVTVVLRGMELLLGVTFLVFFFLVLTVFVFTMANGQRTRKKHTQKRFMYY